MTDNLDDNEPKQEYVTFRVVRSYVVQIPKAQVERLGAFCDENELPFFEPIDVTTRCVDGGDATGTVIFEDNMWVSTKHSHTPSDVAPLFSFEYDVDEVDADFEDYDDVDDALGSNK